MIFSCFPACRGAILYFEVIPRGLFRGFFKIFHAQIPLVLLIFASDIAESRENQHQRRVPVWVRTDNPRHATNFAFQPLNDIVSADLQPVLRRKSHVCKNLSVSFLNFFAVALSLISRSFSMTSLAFLLAASLLS